MELVLTICFVYRRIREAHEIRFSRIQSVCKLIGGVYIGTLLTGWLAVCVECTFSCISFVKNTYAKMISGICYAYKICITNPFLFVIGCFKYVFSGTYIYVKNFISATCVVCNYLVHIAVIGCIYLIYQYMTSHAQIGMYHNHYNNMLSM